MTRLGAVAAAVGLALAVLATTAQAGSTYDGWVGRLGSGPTREGSQGAGWEAVFREHRLGRVRYRVCLRHLDVPVRRCYGRRTPQSGISRVFVALFVNDEGGPGRWRATWSVNDRIVATWRFRVRPEGV
jgi:hypothetical protein